MKRFRFTAAETVGTAVLLLCLVLPFAARRCAPPASVAVSRSESAVTDSIAQARIDSAQATVAAPARARKPKARTFTPSSRDRLADPIPAK